MKTLTFKNVKKNFYSNYIIVIIIKIIVTIYATISKQIIHSQTSLLLDHNLLLIIFLYLN